MTDKNIVDKIKVKKIAGPPKNKIALVKELKEVKKEVSEAKKEIREVKKWTHETEEENKILKAKNEEVGGLLVKVISNQNSSKTREYINFGFWIVFIVIAIVEYFN